MHSLQRLTYTALLMSSHFHSLAHARRADIEAVEIDIDALGNEDESTLEFGTDYIDSSTEDYCNRDVHIRSEVTYKNGSATQISKRQILQDAQLALSKNVGIFVVSKASYACASTYRIQCNTGKVILEKRTSNPYCDTSKDGRRYVTRGSTRRTCLQPGESFVPLHSLADEFKELRSDEKALACLIFEVDSPSADVNASSNDSVSAPDIANHAHQLIGQACVLDFCEQFPVSTNDPNDIQKAVRDVASELDWASTVEAVAIDANGQPTCLEDSSDGQRQLDLVSCLRGMDLKLLVMNLWNLEKMQSAAGLGGFANVMILNLKFFENVVNRIGFSLSRAESVCKSRAAMNLASPSDLRRCVMERLGTEPESKTRRARFRRIAEIEDEIAVQQLWNTEKHINRLGLEGAEGNQDRAHWHWAQSDAEGYMLYSAAVDTCKDLMKDSSLSREAMVMARLGHELTSACSKDKGCKVRLDGPMCPEGHGCLCSRPWTPKRGARAGTIFLAASWPTYVGIGALSGLIVGGPVGAAHGAIAGLALPGKFEGAGAMALLFSRTWSKECMCFPLECKYDKSSKSCTLQLQSEQHASNPFDWLPYPGQKCVKKERKHFYEGSGPVCEMQSCSRTDYSEKVSAVNGTELFGKVGRRDRAVFNCPSIDGTLVGALIVQNEIPQPQLGVEAKTPNTVGSRLDLLRRYYLTGENETELEFARADSEEADTMETVWRDTI